MYNRRKALGQNFLNDPQAIEGIVELFRREYQRCDKPCALMEIGPGKGALTYALHNTPEGREASRQHPMLLVEKDPKLIDFWNQENLPGVRVLGQDFLDVPEFHLPSSYAVVSNLPYSVGTAIARRLLAFQKKPLFLVLMFQKEVAERFSAALGHKGRGSLSVWTQNLWQAHSALQVPPEAFDPPPQVESEVVVFTPRKEVRVEGSETFPDLWDLLLRTAFKQPRKMIRSNFKGPLAHCLDESGVDGALRPHLLAWEDWQKLFCRLMAHQIDANAPSS